MTHGVSQKGRRPGVQSTEDVPGNDPILNEIPVPTSGWKLWLVAIGVSAVLKSKTKSESSGRRA
jgi:hypothetical protein